MCVCGNNTCRLQSRNECASLREVDRHSSPSWRRHEEWSQMKTCRHHDILPPDCTWQPSASDSALCHTRHTHNTNMCYIQHWRPSASDSALCHTRHTHDTNMCYIQHWRPSASDSALCHTRHTHITLTCVTSNIGNRRRQILHYVTHVTHCLLYTSPSPRD